MVREWKSWLIAAAGLGLGQPRVRGPDGSDSKKDGSEGPRDGGGGWDTGHGIHSNVKIRLNR